MSARYKVPVTLLLMFWVLGQTADLAHHHDADLQAQLDCEICLKLGSQDDAIVVTQENVFAAPLKQQFKQLAYSLSFTSIPSPKSRAPPAV